MGQPVMSMMESQWKLRQQHDQNFPMERKPLWNKYILASEKRNKSKRAGLWDPSKKVNHLSKVI